MRGCGLDSFMGIERMNTSGICFYVFLHMVNCLVYLVNSFNFASFMVFLLWLKRAINDINLSIPRRLNYSSACASIAGRGSRMRVGESDLFMSDEFSDVSDV